MGINSLYKSACQGDKTAESELFRHLTARFKYLVQLDIWNKDDAEEIVQDALTTIAEKYGGIDIQSSFSGWAYRVLENKILNYLRSKKYRRSRFVEAGERDDRPYTPDPDMRLKIESCLKRICRHNKRNARMLNLYYQGFTFEEICRRLDLTRNNAYSVLHRARSMLETCLEKGEIE